ncbi:MAG: alpha/beta fold hydrolase [Pseudomonadota bacterium]|nr:alpha/beta fold hydrolase [Pseudomonadota bacterium]
MKRPTERFLDVPLGRSRVWESGSGPVVGYFAGYGGLADWLPLLGKLSANWKIKAPSLPGFPGGSDSEMLDGHLDWLLSVHDTFVECNLQDTSLIGASVGGALAADIAAVWPDEVQKLVLIAPFGVFDEGQPVSDIFAQAPSSGLNELSSKPERLQEWLSPPDGEDAEDWAIVQLRARVAAADILWPLGDTGLRKRLARIKCPTLIIWGGNDNIIPSDYAAEFARKIAGPTRVEIIEGAGHTVEFDASDEVERAISQFLATEF